jgi:preprotein translocase subunit YajC
MARQCKVCSHDKLTEINRALIESRNISELSRIYDLPWDSLKRHKALHLPEVLSKAKKAKEVKEADGLMGQLQSLQNRTLNILKTAEDSKELNTAIRAIAEARRNLELAAKLTEPGNQSVDVSRFVQALSNSAADVWGGGEAE